MHFIITMSNSHKKSQLSFAPKWELFPVHQQKLSLKVDCSLYHLLLFWKRFLRQEIKQIILKFLRDFCLIFWNQDHFQNNNKSGGKNSPSHKKDAPLFW